MRTCALLAALVPAALALLTPKESHAFDVVSLGVGPTVVYGANFLGKPGDKTIGGKPAGDVYPGFGGTGFGYGMMFEVRLFEMVGLEIDYIKRTSKGTGDIDITGGGGAVSTFEVEIKHEGTQIPVLLKGVMPVPLFAPYVLLGKEFISTSNPSSTTSAKAGGASVSNGAYGDNYSYWTFGVGAELKLPIPGWDIRIPFSARGSYNPSISDKLEDRVRIAGNTIAAFDTKFQYQVMGTLGVAGYF